MRIIGFVVFFGMGIFQMAAIIAGFNVWLGWNWFLSLVIALFITYIPLVGQIVGIMGAVKGWGWEWWQAALLFFGGLLAPLVIGGAGALLDFLATPFRRKAGKPE